jgi:hypothetical protein
MQRNISCLCDVWNSRQRHCHWRQLDVMMRRLGVALLRVDEVRELERIAHEEHWRVVADQIPVASSV